MEKKFCSYFVKFSFSGYGTALSFKDLEQSDIQSTEEYVRNSLPIALESALTEKKMEYTLSEKMWFFGPFASAPQHFAFPPGELKTLFALVRYVKQIVDQPNECKGLNHFANATLIAKKGLSYEDNMVESVFGLVFGSLREKKQSKLNENIEVMREELFKRAIDVFQSYETENDIASTRNFTLESVTVAIIDQKLKGRVKCQFCEEIDLSGDVSIYLKPPGYWVLSNLTKHINKYHTNPIARENEAIKGRIQTIKLHVEPMEINEEATEDMLSTTESTTKATTSIEDELYSQLFTQSIKMTNCTVAHKDKISTRNFGLGTGSSKAKQSVTYSRMNANGDCFFLSVAHQLFNVKAGSKEHEDQALNLRKSVVSYIKDADNLPNFLHDLKNRVKYDKESDVSEIMKTCSDFLDVHLSKTGFWAGMESFKAICEMEHVNLVVINEDGTGYLPCHFNPQAKKSILLLFGPQNGKSCKNNSDRSHYDSVVSMHKKKISAIVQQIIEAENHHNVFIKEAADRSAILID